MKHGNSLLTDMLTHLNEMIGKSRICLKTYEEIALKADALRSARFEPAFGIFQRMASSILANEVYNIFDGNQSYDNISIPQILVELEKGGYVLQNPTLYREALKKLGIVLLSDDSTLTREAIKALDKARPNFNDSKALRQVKFIRNKFISHKDKVQAISRKNQTLPSSQDFTELFEWAENFRFAIYAGYITGLVPSNMQSWAERQVSSITELIDFTIATKEKAYSDFLEARDR